MTCHDICVLLRPFWEVQCVPFIINHLLGLCHKNAFRWHHPVENGCSAVDLSRKCIAAAEMGRENALPVQKRERGGLAPLSLSIQFAQYVTSFSKGLLQWGLKKKFPFKVDGKNRGSTEGNIICFSVCETSLYSTALEFGGPGTRATRWTLGPT